MWRLTALFYCYNTLADLERVVEDLCDATGRESSSHAEDAYTPKAAMQQLPWDAYPPGFLAKPPYRATSTLPSCVFCRIVAGEEPARIVGRWADCIAFVPLNPVTPGHVLIVSRDHLTDALESPWQTGNVFMRAAQFASDIDSCNLITSVGEAATQTIKHLHVHVVPRSPGDGLHLPWTGQKVTGRSRPAPPPLRPNMELIGYIEDGQHPPITASETNCSSILSSSNCCRMKAASAVLARFTMRRGGFSANGNPPLSHLDTPPTGDTSVPETVGAWV